MANISNVASAASKNASSAAKNATTAATKASSTAVTNATSTAKSTVTSTVKEPTKTVTTTVKEKPQAVTSVESSGSQSTVDKVKDRLEPLHNDQPKDYYMVGDAAPEDKEVGEKVAPGRVVGEDGTVQKSSTAENMEAAFNVLSTIYTGGSAKAAGSAIKKGTQEVTEQVAKDAAKASAKAATNTAAKGANAGSKEALNAAASAAANTEKQSALSKVIGNTVNSNEISKDTVAKASKIIDKGSGYLAEGIDKIPLSKQVSDFHKELGTSINGVFNAVGDIFAGNFAGAVQNFKKAVSDGAKFTLKSIILLIILTIISFALLVGGLLLPFFILLAPFLHGASQTESTISEMDTTYSSSASASIYGSGLYMTEMVKAVVSEVPNFDGLSNGRKVVVVAAATAIGTEYRSGGKPTDPTAAGISGGVDSGGLIEWVFWNVTGSDPGNIDPTTLWNNSNFVEANSTDLKVGDIGVNGDEVGIYLGSNTWVHASSTQGTVLRGQYDGFTSFYSYKDIDTISVPAGGGDGGGYYSGDGPTGEFRERVIGWAQILHSMDIPYSNAWGYNTARSLDVNGNNFRSIVPAGTKRGNGTKFTEAIDYSKVNKYNLKGLDCGGYAGYVYYLATGGKTTYEFDSYLGGGVPSLFAEVSKEQAKQGDVVIMPNSHVMLLDHFEADGKLFVYEMSGCSTHTYVVNGQELRYSGSTSVGSGCNGNYCKNNYCRYLTYIGPED